MASSARLTTPGAPITSPPTKSSASAQESTARVRRRPDPSSGGGPGSVVAASKVALELPGDRLAGRLGQLDGVLGLLELGDVLGDLGVLGRQLVDPVLPRLGVLRKVAQLEEAKD